MAGQRTSFPESYADPVYAQADQATETKLGLPAGLLSAIRTDGERTNASRISSAGAVTPYQFTPATRKAILKQYGLDVTLSPENASEGAGLLLKEALDRNQGDPEAAVGEYHGGVDRTNWGPINAKYRARVMQAFDGSRMSKMAADFGAWMAQNPAAPAQGSVPTQPGQPPQQPAADDKLSADFGAWLQASKTPEGQPQIPATPEQPLTFLERMKEAVTGANRRTLQTDTLPDWASMPELNTFSLASAKTGLGTLLSNPQETVRIIQANFPGVQVTQDPKGNFLLTSSIDGKQYAIKPGAQISDIPRAAGAVAAFTPAGRATTLGGMALGAGATQAAIEATQAATGGEFNPGEVVTAAALAPVLPAAVNAVRAVAPAARAGVGRVLGKAEIAAPEAELPGAAAVPPPGGAAPAAVPAEVAGARPPVVPAPAAAAVAPAEMGAADLAQTAKKAAEGGMGAKAATRTLAEQAAPDAKVLESAKRLGIEDYLQPDHVTTNQAYRELAQAVKSIPGSEARAAEMRGLAKVAERADKLISDIGGTTDVSMLDAGVKKSLQTTQAELESKANALYDQLREAIPANTEAPASNVLKFIRQRADELGGEANLSPMEKRILGRLSAKPVRTTETVPGNPLMPGSMRESIRKVTALREPTYALLDDVRRDLGAAARQAGPFKDADTGLAKKLYGLLSEDQEAVVVRAGMGEVYGAARKAVAVRKGIEDDLISLFGKQIDGSMVGDLSGAIRALPQGDASKLIKLLGAVPEPMRQQVTASGLASAFRTAGTRGPISFGQYEKWFDGLLRNKQAHATLMSNLPPEVRRQLVDLYRVSKGIAAASRERITTGRIQAVQDQFKAADSLAGKLYEVAKRGALGATVGTAAGSVMGKRPAKSS